MLGAIGAMSSTDNYPPFSFRLWHFDDTFKDEILGITLGGMGGFSAVGSYYASNSAYKKMLSNGSQMYDSSFVPSTVIGTKDFTIDLIFYRYGADEGGFIVSGCNNSNNIELRINASGQISMYLLGVLDSLSFSSTYGASLGYNHVKFGRKGNSGFIVLNGVKTDYNYGSVFSIRPIPNEKFCIGSYAGSFIYTPYCLIDEVLFRIGIGDDSVGLPTKPY